MTLATSNNKVSYVSSGTETLYDFDFPALSIDFIKVFINNVEQGSGFTVTLDPSGTGGMVALSAPAPAGNSVVILRDVPLTQDIDYNPYGPFPSETHERGLDLGVARDQQLQEQLGRSLKFPIGSDVNDQIDALPNDVLIVKPDGSVGGIPLSDFAPDSAAQLKLDLANDTDPSKGASLVGHSGTNVSGYLDSYTGSLFSTGGIQAAGTRVETIDGMNEQSPSPLIEYPTTDYDVQYSIRDVSLVSSGVVASGLTGDVNYYGALRLMREGAHAAFVSFDGNGFGTFEAYNPSIVNHWIVPIAANSDQQVVFANNVKRSCGHAIEGSAVDNLRIIANYAFEHNGIGNTNGDRVVYASNISQRTSDSHYYTNSNDYAVVIGNIGTEAIAASGLDIAGGTKVAAVGNVFCDNQFSGIWALKSPNTGALLNTALISSNLLSSNTNYPGVANGQGEITLGDYNNKLAFQGQDWFVTGNLVKVDGAGFSCGMWVHKFVANPVVSGNHFCGELDPSDANTIIDAGAEWAKYVGNTFQQSTAGAFAYSKLYIESKTAGKGATYANNQGLRIASNSPVRPEVMHDEDGNWRYSCVVQSSVNPYTLVRLINEGGNTTYLVKLTLCSRGSANGFYERTICLRGNSGAGTVVVSDVVGLNAGDPLSVTIDTSASAYTAIVVPAHTHELSIKLEVVSPVSDRLHILMFP